MIKLTVLGNNGPYPAPGGACSGYLVESENAKVVIDMGSGAFANLLKIIEDPEEIDAVILTHLHGDHMSDIFVMRYALELTGRNSKLDRNGKTINTNLYCPNEPKAEFNLLSAFERFNVIPIHETLQFNVAELQFSFARMIHGYPCYAVAVSDGEKKMVFSGDTSWTQDLILFAEDADLLLIDSNFRESDKRPDKKLAHLTAWECGIIAGQADVTKLLLTHFLPGSELIRFVKEAEMGILKVFENDEGQLWDSVERTAGYPKIIVEATEILATYIV